MCVPDSPSASLPAPPSFPSMFILAETRASFSSFLEWVLDSQLSPTPDFTVLMHCLPSQRALLQGRRFPLVSIGFLPSKAGSRPVDGLQRIAHVPESGSTLLPHALHLRPPCFSVGPAVSWDGPLLLWALKALARAGFPSVEEPVSVAQPRAPGPRSKGPAVPQSSAAHSFPPALLL